MNSLSFRRGAITLFAALACAAPTLLAGCDEDPVFTKAMVLGGKRISAERLEEGRESYTHYCRACHGDNGDGRGVAALGLRPPPRDFSQAKFKFAAVESGQLPSDEDLKRIVRSNLHGTAMVGWDVPEGELNNIIQYIKTFTRKTKSHPNANERWQKGKPGAPIVAPPDPWEGQEQAAISRGKDLYHVTTQCSGCHANYATRDDIAAMNLRIKKQPITDFRPDMYGPVSKESEYKVTLRPEDQPPNAGKHHHAEGEGEKAEGAKEEGAKGESQGAKATAPAQYTVWILPPDFLASPLRSVHAHDDRDMRNKTPAQQDEMILKDIWRVIAAGVGGTAMPSWKATAPYTDPTSGEHWDGEKDIWALAHYVKSLIDIKDTAEGAALRAKLLSQPAWVPPPPPAPAPEAPAAPADDKSDKADKAGAKDKDKKGAAKAAPAPKP